MPFAVAAAAITVGGAVASGLSKKKAGKQEAAMHEFNAHNIELDTVTELVQQRRKAYKEFGAAQAGAGANGVMQSGSVLDVLAESARNANEDYATISRRGAADAQLERMGGAAARSAGNAGLVSDILGGVSSAAGSYGKYSSSRSMSNNAFVSAAPYRSTGLV